MKWRARERGPLSMSFVHCVPPCGALPNGVLDETFRRIEPRSRIPPAGFPCIPCIAACTFPAHWVGEVFFFFFSFAFLRRSCWGGRLGLVGWFGWHISYCSTFFHAVACCRMLRAVYILRSRERLG